MAIGPLETLSNPQDGSYATAANFGTPVYHGLAALLGTAAGSPDTNNGAPVQPRTMHSGMLPFTNAQGNGLYPGADPQSAYSAVSALSYTVPNGTQLVITQIGLATVASAPTFLSNTVTTGAATVPICSASAPLASANQAPGTFGMPLPLVLEQGWLMTVQQGSSWFGYSVLRDTQITPVVLAVTNVAGTFYTVPLGKTFWLLGCTYVTASTAGAQLLANGAVLCSATISFYSTSGPIYTNAGQYGSAIAGPVPLPAGTVLSSNSVIGVSFWGILL